jgi:hypothetical protein
MLLLENVLGAGLGVFAFGDREDPAQGAGVLVELASDPGQPAEGRVRPLRSMTYAPEGPDVPAYFLELPFQDVPALTERPLGCVGEPVEHGWCRVLRVLHRELEPCQGVLATARDE